MTLPATPVYPAGAEATAAEVAAGMVSAVPKPPRKVRAATSGYGVEAVATASPANPAAPVSSPVSIVGNAPILAVILPPIGEATTALHACGARARPASQGE